MINSSRLVNTFLDLVRIDSPAGGEKDAAEFVAAYLRALGLNPKTDKLHNVTATLPGKGEPFLVNAHLDSVAPCLGVKPRVAGEVIRSDGTTVLGADDRAGVAAILEALSVLSQDAPRAPHRPVEIVITTQEEIGLFGARAVDCARLKSKIGVCLDAYGKVGTLVTQSPTHDTLDVKITGKPAHSGIEPEKGVSAIVVAAQALAAMPLGRVDADTTANFGIVHGGIARNIVAPECTLQGEVRSQRVTKLVRQEKTILRALAHVAKQHGAQVEMRVTRMYNQFRFTRRDEVVRQVSLALGRIGCAVSLEASGGGSDANIFNAQGIAVVPVGVGFEKIHTTEEFMPIHELVKSAQLVVELARL